MGPVQEAGTRPAADRSALLLDAKGVQKRFGGNQALAGVDLQIERGKIWGLIGPNGSGKTTLFNCITGFEKIDGGEILWRGRSIAGMSPDRLARMGLVRSFQQVMAFAELTPRQCLARAIHVRRSAGRSEAPNEDLPKDVDALLGLGGVTDVADRVAGELSYGMQRLVNVTMAVATRPWLLMLDEPVAGLHPSEARQLATLVRSISAAGTTVVIIDHNVSFIAGLCDRVVVIDEGKNLTDGTPDQVRADPRVIDVYLGSNADRRPKEAHV